MLSRIRLLTQFRLAWHPIFFAVAIPILPWPRSAESFRFAVATRFPLWKTDSNVALLSPVLGRNLVAALGSASLERVLAIGRSHSDPEPVGFAPVPIIGLVGPFHRLKSSLWGLDTALYPNSPRFIPGLRLFVGNWSALISCDALGRRKFSSNSRCCRSCRTH